MTLQRSGNAEATRELGFRLGRELKSGDVVALEGPLGAGKTVFVQGLAGALGITEAVSSPTFTIISEYRGSMTLYHMDLYRLNTPEEFAFLGVEEMIEGDGVTVVEWSEKAGDELPERSIRVNITIGDDGERLIQVGQPKAEFSLR